MLVQKILALIFGVSVSEVLDALSLLNLEHFELLAVVHGFLHTFVDSD